MSKIKKKQFFYIYDIARNANYMKFIDRLISIYIWRI
jgi:hypothetical protein